MEAVTNIHTLIRVDPYDFKIEFYLTDELKSQEFSELESWMFNCDILKYKIQTVINFS